MRRGYPVTASLGAATFAAIAAVHGLVEDLLFLLPFAAMLIAAARIDLARRIVPNRLLLVGAAWGLAGTVLLREGDVPEFLVAAGGAVAALLPVAVLSSGGLGMGDVKLAGVMGLYLGASVVPALLVAFLTGSIVGIAAILRDGGSARKRTLPFAPFLALGGLAGALAGPELVTAYTASA